MIGDILGHQHLICEVCYAQVPLTPDWLYQGHLAWHRTLTNQPAPRIPTLESG